MTSGGDTPTLVLTIRALAVRRLLDPMAWLVLEELALRSEPGAGPATVQIDVRSLAAGLGRSRDAVGRAVRVLIDVGLADRQTSRDGLSGRFGAAGYWVDLDAAGLRRPRSDDPATFAPGTPRTPAARPAPTTRRPTGRLLQP